MPKRCFRAVFAGFVLGFAVLSPAQAQPARHIAALAVKDGPVVRLAPT
jgi:hypothetical protein